MAAVVQGEEVKKEREENRGSMQRSVASLQESDSLSWLK